MAKYKDSDFNMEEVQDVETSYAGNMDQFEESYQNNDFSSNVVYEESENKKSLTEYVREHKNIFLIILLVLILLIIFLLFGGCSRKGDIESLKLDVPDVMYVGENDFEVSAVGSGSLKKTEYNFYLSDTEIASLESESLKGKKVTNTINALSSGEVTLTVNAQLKDKKLEELKDILICKKFDENAIVLKELTLNAGQTFSLSSNFNLGVDECYKGVTWKSSSNNVTIKDGVVTTNKTGKTTITVTNSDGEKQEFTINVIGSSTKVTGVKLSKTKLSLKVGETSTVTATISPSNASIKDVTWSSNNESIAKVKNGKITAVGIGTAIISATTVDGNYKASVEVNVTGKGSSSGTINKPTASLCKKITYNGRAQQLTTLVNATGYSLKNYKQTNAGTYTITAELKSGYKWSDGTTKDVTFKCSLNKATSNVSVKIVGTNRVGSTLTASVTTNSPGSRTYQWWYKTSENSSKVIIKNSTTSTLKLTDDYLDKYIGVTVTVAESTNYKTSSGSDVTDKANNSSNKVGEKEDVSAKYKAPSTPTITASDGIASGKWHTKNVTLNFSGSTITDGLGSVVYYYGTSSDSLTNTGATTGEISTSGTTTYYVKACNSGNTSNCSSTVSYELKIDTTRPVISYYKSSSYTSRIIFKCTDNESGIYWKWGEWKKSTSSSWSNDWSVKYSSFQSNVTMYWDIWSTGTHNTYVWCKNNAGLTNEWYVNFYQPSYQGSFYAVDSSSSSGSSSGSGNSGSGNSSSSSETTQNITGYCNCTFSSGNTYVFYCSQQGLTKYSECYSHCVAVGNANNYGSPTSAYSTCKVG